MDFVRNAVARGCMLAGRRVAFLAASSNQLRQQQLLFVDVASLPDCGGRVLSEESDESSDDDPSENEGTAIDDESALTPEENFRLVSFRGQLVDEERSSPCVSARFLSRLALWCTSDTPTCAIESVGTKEDLRTVGDGTLLTDGAGAIAHSVARRVSRQYLKLSETPSALQVRCRGAKGVLLVVPDDSDFLDGREIMFRRSMEKFTPGPADDGVLCVVNHARALPLYLNREIITLLTGAADAEDARLVSSGYDDGLYRFDPRPTLEHMQETALHKAAEIFTDPDAAVAALKSENVGCLALRALETTRKHGDLLNEPFWVRVLQVRYKLVVRELVEKTRIPVLHGVELMGVADPLGILNDGEIFVAISADQLPYPETAEKLTALSWNSDGGSVELYGYVVRMSDSELPPVWEWNSWTESCISRLGGLL